MFTRFQKTGHRLQAIIVEYRRGDGKVPHNYGAGRGSIAAQRIATERIDFWTTLHQHLARLSNRVNGETAKRLFRLFTRPEIVSILVLSGTLIGCLRVSLGYVSLAAGVTVTAVIMLMLLAGRCTLMLLSPSSRALSRIGARYATGFGVLSIILSALTLGLRMRMAWGVAIAAAVIVSAAALPSRSRIIYEPRDYRSEIAILAMICGSTVLWSWRAVVSYGHLLDSGVFLAWSDFFIHSAEVAQCAASGQIGNIFASGLPLPIYHYGSYMVPAILVSFASVPALSAVTAFWTPLSFIILGCGAYSLGDALAGRGGGIGALTAVLLVPDAAHYGLADPVFDFHWLMQIGPHGSFAVGMALLSVGAVLTYVRDSNVRALWLAVILDLMVFAMRVHIFVPLTITNGLLFLGRCWVQDRRVFAGAVVAGALAVAGGSLVAERIPRAPHFLTGARDMYPFLIGIPPALFSSNQGAIMGLGWWGANIVGLAMLPFAAFGVFFPICVTAAILPHPQWKGMQTSHAFLAVLSYILVLGIFPITELEPNEFQHRPFLFVYGVLASSSGAYLWVAIRSKLNYRGARLVLGPTLIGLLVVPATLGKTAQVGRLPTGPLYAVNELSPGLLQAARYIRTHAAVQEVVALSVGELDEYFVGLAERTLFVPTAPFLVVQASISKPELARRREIVHRLLTTANGDNLCSLAREETIHWLVTGPRTSLLPPITESASFSSAAYVVTNLARACQF
jgi:hypothetical protein